MNQSSWKFWLPVLLIACLTGACNRQTGSTIEAIPRLSPQEHLLAAEALKRQSDDWPLAIWHYQQFFEGAEENGIQTAEIDRARVQFEELRQSYVALFSGTSRNSLEAEIAALRRANQALEDQSERLKADNAVLNSTLLKMQQAAR